MMAVNSYPELFTILLGWQQYQNLWDIIVQTGLGFVPFIVMIVTHTVEPFTSQEAKSAYTISLRRVEFSLATMCLVLMFACQPMMTIDPQVIHFQPICGNTQDATPGNSGTTYDEAFPNLQPVKVPLWWYAIIAISHGITAAANVGMGCTPSLRGDEIKLNLTRIRSAPLRAEVQQFISSCWLPSWKKYNEEKPDITGYTKQYGTSDPEWIGSHAFTETPGYYDTFYAPEPIEGFPYEQGRDWAQGQQHGQWGSPSCQDWWTEDQIGLHDQLKAQVDPTLWENITSRFQNVSAPDAVLKTLIGNSITSGYQDNTQDLSKMTGGNAGGMGTGLVSGVGLFWDSSTFFPKMYALIETLPLIQAYLLMACYAFLAIALPASRYRFGTVMSLSFIIFSIIFWSYLWQLAVYIDSAMIQALDPMGGFNGVNEGTYGFGGTPILTDIVAVLMYFFMPVFFSMFMGWAGIKVGNGMTSIIDKAGGVTSGGAVASAISSGLSRTLPK